ncbi:MAG TPA: chromosome segregation protein SMC, partial [Candidatus Limnocylindrales bacterium]
MTGAARLLSVRLQGFKSFAERTHVEFGPGISAVVGPNGSGKSNLADALRWALGEQGRALRSRKAEDVIWAGSERRPALGMADVQLVVDNADGLLPVEYGVVELGRRLYRSGENDYLLNRQRVRLKDLVDLLDAAHLADNAFLFIGQGMVDQALALRPEERRPLFEEVAGVRRHERRRRRAEEQLAESDANLARVEDILGELRPQARRLAAQAEQQASRRTAGDELALAVLDAAHARWHAASRRAGRAETAGRGAVAALDAAMIALAEREGAVAAVAAELAGRGAVEAEARAALDAALARVTELRIRAGAVRSELAAAERDRRRMADERPALETELARAAAVLAAPVPVRDDALEAELARAEGQLAEATGDVRPDNATSAADEAVIRRLELARRADAEATRRRLLDSERHLAAERERAGHAAAAREAAAAERARTTETVGQAMAAVAGAREARQAGERALAEAGTSAAAAATTEAAARGQVAGARGRVEQLERTLAAEAADAFTTAAVARGGRRLDADVVAEPDLRLAVRAALSGLGRAVVVPRVEVAGLARERGTAIVEEAAAGSAAATDPRVAPFLAEVERRGGGSLASAIRRDDRGTTRRLLERAAWLPDVAACLDLQPLLPPGWIALSRDGRAVVGDVVVQLGVSDASADARQDLERARAELRDAEVAHAAASTLARDAAETVGRLRADLEHRRTVEAEAVTAGRRAEEADRAAAARVDGAARETAWLDAQLERLRGEVERLRAQVAHLDPAPAEDAGPAAVSGATSSPTPDKQRIASLRANRDRLAALASESEARRAQAERQRAAADASLALGRSRLAALDATALELAERDARLDGERASLEADLVSAEAGEREARARLDEHLRRDAADRARLTEAEAAATAARERVASAQGSAQSAERETLEARLGVEAVREQVLVELTGLGAIGLRHLESGADAPEPGFEPGSVGDDEADDEARLTSALETAAVQWARTDPPESPSPARIATLRRRFHELGAGNPFAADEYAEVKARLDALETQRADLASAIERTRALIVELDTLIATQFRTTFAALERAFESRFQQLFGGGYAKLSLTDPADLAATGVEIVARPPGKKPQPLAMLSGGERALTAVALLFAMLEVRPVPFCVLDEVDAALDEANIGRFTDALRELSARTQCIVITHNRGTIEVADALYGVTV